MVEIVSITYHLCYSDGLAAAWQKMLNYKHNQDIML